MCLEELLLVSPRTLCEVNSRDLCGSGVKLIYVLTDHSVHSVFPVQ